jgi:hypothetical protein
LGVSTTTGFGGSTFLGSSFFGSSFLGSSLGACHFAGESLRGETTEEVEEEVEVVRLGVRSSPSFFLARSFCCQAGMLGFDEADEALSFDFDGDEIDTEPLLASLGGTTVGNLAAWGAGAGSGFFSGSLLALWGALGLIEAPNDIVMFSYLSVARAPEASTSALFTGFGRVETSSVAGETTERHQT